MKRVRGDIEPPVWHDEPYPPKKGYSECRIRLNAEQVTVTDEMSGESHSEWEYDEWIFIVPDTEVESLKAMVEAGVVPAQELKSELAEVKVALTKVYSDMGMEPPTIGG